MVLTAVGRNVRELCEVDHPPGLLDMLEAQEHGTQVYGIAVRGPLSVRLVPQYWHDKVLSSQRDFWLHGEVFSDRHHTSLGRQQVKLVPSSDTDQMQMIVLRAVVIDTTPTAVSGHGVLQRHVLLLVKMWNTTKDTGSAPALTLGAVFAKDICAGEAEWAPFLGRGDPNEDQAYIELRKSMVAPEKTQFTVKKTAPGKTSAKKGHRQQASVSKALTDDAAASALPETGNRFMEWDVDDGSPEKPPAKRPKQHSLAALQIEFGSSTCQSTSTKEQRKAIKNMTVDAFVNEYVLGGLSTAEDPDISGHALRKVQAQLWHNVFAFWGKPAVQHLAGVLALCLDGYGHGAMLLLSRDKHLGCTGRWDMYAVWAAHHLNQFPPKFVSTLSESMRTY